MRVPRHRPRRPDGPADHGPARLPGQPRRGRPRAGRLPARARSWASDHEHRPDLDVQLPSAAEHPDAPAGAPAPPARRGRRQARLRQHGRLTAWSKLQSVQATSDDLAVKAATGDLTDVHDYMIAANEASVATQLTVAVRNKARRRVHRDHADADVKGLNPAALLDKVRSLFSGFTGGQKAMTAIAVVAALVGGGPVRVVGLQADVRPAVQRPVLHRRGARSRPSWPRPRSPTSSPTAARRSSCRRPTSTSSGSPSAAKGLPSGNGGGDGYSLLDKQGMTTSRVPAAGDLPAGPRGRAAQDHRGDRRRADRRRAPRRARSRTSSPRTPRCPPRPCSSQTSPTSPLDAGPGRGDRAPGLLIGAQAHRRPGHRRRQLRTGPELRWRHRRLGA